MSSIGSDYDKLLQVLKLESRSANPKFSRIYLDAFIQTFIDQEASRQKTSTAPEDDYLVTIQERASPAFEKIESWTWAVFGTTAMVCAAALGLVMLAGWLWVATEPKVQPPTLSV